MNERLVSYTFNLADPDNTASLGNLCGYFMLPFGATLVYASGAPMTDDAGCTFDLMDDGNYRLMHLLNFKSDRIERLKPREYSFTSENPDNNIKTKFLHWLPATPNNIHVEITMPDGSITKGLGEPELHKLKEGTTIQFERFGFAKLHKKSKDKLQFWFTHNL